MLSFSLACWEGYVSLIIYTIWCLKGVSAVSLLQGAWRNNTAEKISCG